MIFPSAPTVRNFRTDVGGISMHGTVLSQEMTGADIPNWVLVHGLGMSGRYLMPMAQLLAGHGRVYLPDLPGFGRSGNPPQVLSIPQLADALAAWMASQPLGVPVLIGNSLGAQVIVDFAVRYPERLAGAVLVGPTADPHALKVSTHLGRLLVDIWREPAGLYGMGLADYLRAGFGRCLRTLRHALADPVVGKLPSIRCPVLIVRGGRDPIVPQRWVELATGLIPNARLVIIPAAAHAVNFDAPEALVAEVLDFHNQENVHAPRG